MPVPPLRNVDVVPIESDGQRLFLLNDREGISKRVGLSGEAMLVVAFMDGVREIPDIQAEIAKHADGHIVPSEAIEKLVAELDGQGYLLTEKFAAKLRRVEEAFVAAPVRPAAMADASYPADAAELRAMLDGYLAEAPVPAGGPPLAGAISPHIDFMRGGTCYAHAYGPIAERAKRAETFVILGTAHSSPPEPFTVLDKPFATPLGMAPVDTEVTGRLRRTGPAWSFDNAFVHRSEHSAEFQVVWLQHVRRERPFSIVPILCGGIDEENRAQAEAFLIALRDALAPLGDRAFILAGADLAHVGPRFGDPEELTPAHIERMEREDAVSLDAIRAGDAEAFYKSVMEDGNRRHVCGLGSVYAALRLLGGRRGEVLKYGHAADPAGGEVSFVSAVFA